MTTTAPFHRAGTRISRTKNRKVSVFVPPSNEEVVIPNHKTLDKGTLREIIRQIDFLRGDRWL